MASILQKPWRFLVLLIDKVLLSKSEPVVGWERDIGPSCENVKMEDFEEINYKLINVLSNFVPVIKAGLAFEGSCPRGLISAFFFFFN